MQGDQSQYQSSERNPPRGRPGAPQGSGLGAAGWILAGAAIGGLAAYFLDPVSGRTRRALVRDKIVHYQNQLSWNFGKQRRHLNNQVRGWLAKASQSVVRAPEKIVDDEMLVLRVRSELGRKVSHMRSLHITAQEGTIFLRGQILAHEIEGALACIKAVPGVKDIVNELEIHEKPDHISGLQGEGKPYLKNESDDEEQKPS